MQKDKMIDDKILELLIRIRWSEGDDLNGVAVNFSSRHIWAEMARVVNAQVFPNPNLSATQLFKRTKNLKRNFTTGGTVYDDKLNNAFGPYINCGHVARFPNTSPGTSPEAVSRSASNSQHSSPQGSDSGQSPLHNSVHLVARRISALVNNNQITLLEALRATEWLEMHPNAVGYLYLILSESNLITVIRDRLYDPPP